MAEALDIITEGNKTQFDPVPVRALIKWVDQMGERQGKGWGITVEDLLEDLHAGAMIP